MPTLDELPRRVYRAWGEEGNGWRQSIEVEIEGVRYASAGAAAAALGMNPKTVHSRCRSESFPAWVQLGQRVEKDWSDALPVKDIIDPAPWPFDGGEQRNPVVDPNFDPPLVIGHKGWARCLKCWRWAFSAHVAKERVCSTCKPPESSPSN